MLEIDSGFPIRPEYHDTLNNKEGETEYSLRFFNGSIFTRQFIDQERQREEKTIVFDLDGTLRGWDEKENISFLRHSLKNILDQLKTRGYRLVIWTSATRDSVQQTLNKYPEFENYWSFIITAENYSFGNGFLSEKEKMELKKISPADYDLMSRGLDQEKEENWTYFYRPPKNIHLFNYSVLIDDDPRALDNAREFGFSCLSVVPYQYFNPGSSVTDSVDIETKKIYEKDFTQNLAKRIIETIENPEELNPGAIYQKDLEDYSIKNPR